MSLFRSLILSVVPGRTRRSIEEESRRWVVRCECGEETSIWEMGGIRYKAAGNPKKMVQCGSCGKTFFGTLEYREGKEKTTSDDLDRAFD